MKTLGLSEDLKRAVQNSPFKSIQIGTLLNVAGDRAFGLVLIILSLPSALPIPATGISTPLGIAMFLIALQMIAGRPTLWLPKRIQRMKISISVANKMIQGLAAILKVFERFIKPRWKWMGNSEGHRVVGLTVALLSVVMQVPVPLTNTLPAAAIFLMAICLTEDDGLLGIFATSIAVTVVMAYALGFGSLFFLGLKSFDQLFEWLQSRAF